MDLNSRDANIASTFDKGLQAHNSGDLSAAEQLYQKTLAMQPDHCEANHNIGAVLVAKNELDKALEFFKFALDTSPNVSLFWASYIDALIKLDRISESKTLVKAVKDAGISCDKIEALAQRLDVEHQDPRPKETSELDALIEQQKFDDAIKACLSLMETYPSSAVLNITLGKCYCELGQAETAISCYEKATEYQPKWTAGFVMLGQIYSAQGNTDQAIHSLKKALKLQPENYELNSTLGIELLQNDEVDEAIKYLKNALSENPKSSANLCMIGDAYDKKGDHQLAITYLKQAIEINPDDAMSHFSLAGALYASGSSDAAIDSYKKAIKIKSDYAEAYNNLGNALNDTGDHETAIKKFKKAIKIRPEYTEAYSNLGNALNDKGDHGAAVKSYQKAIKLKPDYAEIYNNMGIALNAQGKQEEAIGAHKKALSIKPKYPDAYNNIGIALNEQGKLQEAIKAHKKALSINPEYSDAYNNIGIILNSQGKSVEAIEAYKKALVIKPDYAEVYNNMALALSDQGKLKEAIEAYEKALAIKPDYAGVYSNMGLALNEQGKPQEALDAFRKALVIKPDNLDIVTNLAIQISHTGDLDTAIEMLREVLKEKPGSRVATSALIFTLAQSDKIDEHQLSVEARSYAKAIEAPFISKWPDFSNSRDPDRCLQIGFVSGDFRQHSVACFIAPMLEKLKTYPKLTLHAYYTHNVEDAVTENLKKCFHHWNFVKHVSDQKLASNIIDDKIDILIDLSNHTSLNKLAVFARKPAPLQVTSVGLPTTTGLTAIDYFFGDNFNFRDQDFSECYVKLPSVAAYRPTQRMPSVNALPALKNRFITFASFNRTARINRSCITLWSRLLREIPNAHFLFAGQSNEDMQNKFTKWFHEEEIELTRITFLPNTTFNEYTCLHHKVDVHLMSFPFTGGTTISNALWMGVPSLGLNQQGDQQDGVSHILSNAGLLDYYAKSEDDFISKGRHLASEFTELASIRANLRKEFSSSAYCSPDISAASWETAIRLIWKRWCSGLDAKAIKVGLNDLKYPKSDSTSLDCQS